jgi:hypothetical protein
MVSTDWEQSPVAFSHEHDDESAGSTKADEFLSAKKLSIHE